MVFLKQKKFMYNAIKKADQGIDAGQTPFGACIEKNGKIIACAHNVVWKKTDITAHAEIQAIRLACKKLKTINLSGCVIYSTCEPCPMCFAACHWANISAIVFGARIADAKRFGFNELMISNKQMKLKGKSLIRVVSGFMKDENIALFKKWNTKKINYAY